MVPRMTDIDTSQPSRALPRPQRIALAVIVPLCLVGLAYVLWWTSDRLYVGPLDRAAFFWIVVVPTWLAAAPAAAVTWTRVPLLERRVVAIVLAGVIGIIVAILYWVTTAFPACEFGAIWSSDAVAVRGLMLGAVIGAGPAIAGLTGAARGRGHLWRTVVVASVVGLGMSLLSLFVFAMFLTIPACQRPPF